MEESEIDANPFKRENLAPPPYDKIAKYVVSQVPEDCFYDLQNKKGLLVILNHFEYQKGYYRKVPKARIGTSADTKRLRETFRTLNFEVEDHLDLTYDETMDTINNVSRRDHTNTSCLAVCVLTHGDAGGVLFAADRTYKAQEIYARFNGENCPSLAAAPKLFFIQACRGAQLDDGVEIDSESCEYIRLPLTADFLIMYSTVEDFVSWRDKDGSWFMQALCDEIEKHHAHMDLLHILTFVNARVAYSRASHTPGDPRMHNKKQMPEIVSKLTKLLRFTKP